MEGACRDELVVETLKRCKIFKHLSATGLKGIAALATPLRVARGSYIFRRGDPADMLYIVQDGLVNLHIGSPSGQYLTLAIVSVGDTLNGSALSLDSHFMTAQAMSDTVLLRIGRVDFSSLLKKYPSIAVKIIRLTARQLKAECRRMMDMQKDEECRFAYCLLSLAERLGTTLLVTGEELAGFAGTTTETTTRLVSILKKKGILSGSSQHGQIAISDLDKLQVLAGSGTFINYLN